jgi:hypothetical protein
MDLRKEIICIDTKTNYIETTITIGKKYIATIETDTNYFIKDDKKEAAWYPKRCFNVL